jgi:hypothetical protein
MSLREATPGTANRFSLNQQEMTRERQPPTFSAQFPLDFPLASGKKSALC